METKANLIKLSTKIQSQNPFTKLLYRSPRLISTGQLSASQHLHLRPITRSSSWSLNRSRGGISYLRAGFTLRCFQRLSHPNIATQLCKLASQLVHQRSVHPGPLVLRTEPFKSPTPTADRDRTVSRRSEPSSRTALMGEQPNPWDRIQPQDAMSRHRGAKPRRRYGLLGVISLLSPG